MKQQQQRLHCTSDTMLEIGKRKNMVGYMPDLAKVEIGSRISVYWPEGNQYYEALVSRVHHKTRLLHFLEYDDGESEWIDLCQHKFHMLPGARRRNDDEIEDDSKSSSSYDSVDVESETAADEYQDENHILKKVKLHNVDEIERSSFRIVLQGNKSRRIQGKENATSEKTGAEVDSESETGMPYRQDKKVIKEDYADVERRTTVDCVLPPPSLLRSPSSAVAQVAAFVEGLVEKAIEEMSGRSHKYATEKATKSTLRKNHKHPIENAIKETLGKDRKHLLEKATKDTSGTNCKYPIEKEIKEASANYCKYSIGTKVRKLFEGHGWFDGEVTSHDGENFVVTYEDGDSEEYNEHELAKIILTPSLAKVEVGSRVAVHWPAFGKYYEATVARERSKKRLLYLEYDDGHCEWTDLRQHIFRLLPGGTRCRSGEEIEDDSESDDDSSGSEPSASDQELDESESGGSDSEFELAKSENDDSDSEFELD